MGAATTLLATAVALLAGSAGAYSVKSFKTLFDGLHETSVEEALSQSYKSLLGLTASTALDAQWTAGLGASFTPLYTGKGDCTQAKDAKGAFTACFKLLVAKLTAGAAEPDNAACPDTFRGASMVAQLKYAPYAAVNPLGPCRSAIQPYHGSPPQLVVVDGLAKTQLGDAAAVTGAGISVLARPTDANNALVNPPLAASIDNMQWRTNIVARIAHLAAVSAVLPSPLAAAAKIGAAFHILGDTYSASHVQRADDVTAVASSALSGVIGKAADGEKYINTAAACSAALGVQQAFSMDVVRWMKHFAADVDKSKTAHGARLFRCLQLHIEEVLLAWMTLRAEGSAAPAPRFNAIEAAGSSGSALRGGAALQPAMDARLSEEAASMSTAGVYNTPSLERVNTFVDAVVTTVCSALHFKDESPTVLAAPAGGANAAFSSATNMWKLLSANLPAKSMQPAGVVAAADFAALRTMWDEELQVFREVQETAKQGRVPARYWLPSRGWDACAAGASGRGRLAVTSAERTEWSSTTYQTAVDVNGGYLLPPRELMLADLSPALTKGDAKWEAAAARLANDVKMLKAYAAKADAAKADSKKSHAEISGADAVPEDPDTHGIGAFE